MKDEDGTLLCCLRVCLETLLERIGTNWIEKRTARLLMGAYRLYFIKISSAQMLRLAFESSFLVTIG